MKEFIADYGLAIFFIIAGIVSVFWIFDWHPFRGMFPLNPFQIPDTGSRDVEKLTMASKYGEVKKKMEPYSPYSMADIFGRGQTSGIPGSVYHRRHHEPHHRKRHTRKRRVAR